MPLQFPCGVKLSDDSRSFIKGCLVSEEVGRFSWEQVFTHPVYAKFADKFEDGKSPIIVDDNVKSIITELQGVIAKFDVNIEKLFNKFDANKEGTLSRAEFTKLIQVIDKNVSLSDASKCFDQFDVNKDGSITIEEFKKLVIETNYKEESPDDNQLLVDYRAKKLLKKMNDMIIQNNIDLVKVFRKFDTSGDKQMSEVELGKLLKVIDDTLNDQDVHFIFRRFDRDGNGSVCIDEFEKFFSIEKEGEKVDVGKNEAKFPQGASSSAQKMLKELKEIIQINQLDVQLVFKNFDTSGDNQLNLSEFTKLIKVINSRFTEAEVQDLFKAFDINNDKSISFKEFNQYLA